MKRMSEFPNLPKADGAGQVAMKAWAGAACVEVPEQYMVAMSDEVFTGFGPSELHTHWSAPRNLPTSWHDLKLGQGYLAIVYRAAVIVEFQRQGFMTDVR